MSLVADKKRPVKIPTPKELNDFREAQNLSQARFGELLGVSGRAVRLWEAGERRPTKSAALLFWLYKKNPEKISEE